LRLAIPAERSALQELQRRASLMWEEDRAALLANPDAIELPLEYITGRRTIVAESGQLLGFVVVLRREDGEAELDGLFVEPSQWRRGIGRALVDQAERVATADGAATLWVTANTRARAFYDSCGFVTVGEVATRFRPAPRMRKTIDGAR